MSTRLPPAWHPAILLIQLWRLLKMRFGSPTKSFPPATADRLSLDSDRATLNGIRPGSAVGELSMFGPAEDYERYQDLLTLYFPRFGLVVLADSTGVLDFEVHTAPSDQMRLIRRSFPGVAVELIVGSRAIRIDASTDERALRRLLGDPSETEEYQTTVAFDWYREQCMVTIHVDKETRRVTQVSLDPAVATSPSPHTSTPGFRRGR